VSRIRASKALNLRIERVLKMKQKRVREDALSRAVGNLVTPSTVRTP
jgi:hypothetical protein